MARRVGQFPSEFLRSVAAQETRNTGSFAGYGACVAMALTYFNSRWKEKKDILCTACASMAAYALEIDDPFVGRAAALAAGYFGANNLSLGSLTGAFASVSAYFCLQAGFPLGICIPAAVGYHVGKELRLGSYATAGTAAAFVSLIRYRCYRVIALATLIDFFISRKGHSLRVASSFESQALDRISAGMESVLEFLCSNLGERLALVATGGISAIAAHKGFSSLTKITAIRALILVIGGKAACQFYHRSYTSKKVGERMERIVPSSLHTWIMTSDRSAHLVQAPGRLEYVIYSSASDQILQEGNIPLPPDRAPAESISYLRGCYLAPGADACAGPRLSRVNKIWTFSYNKLPSFGERWRGISDTITGVMSLHRQTSQGEAIAYQWRWRDIQKTRSQWTDPFVLSEENLAWGDWWPTSELPSQCMVWPDDNDNVVNALKNYEIAGQFLSWRGLPALYHLNFYPKTVKSKYNRRVSIDPNHFAITLVSSGTRGSDVQSWGGHAKVAIEYIENGEHAIRYIHMTVQNGVIHRHHARSEFRNYNVKTNTVQVPKARVKAAVATRPPVTGYQPCGGTTAQNPRVTHNCYTYCVDFLRRLHIEISSVEGLNVPNLLIPFQQLQSPPQ